ncbi:aminomethyltransferase [Hydrogenivirga caldilitoris]|uniref:Aminomethyltransferase n=2 Tax=Hydrogenivirga caldilitoris TaxID=246264 RepID=A0A497XMP9_9AQUI|nr:aminomethyltransferase [Hydrogenivirga caldilitoris]
MRTPFYEIHKELGARFTDFNGWEMPLQYSGIVEEVRAVREEAGVFDISHMGRLLISSGDAFNVLQQLTTNNLEKLKPGKVQYNLLTNERGGVKDDITLYMLSQDKFFICVNAGNRDKVKEWLGRYLPVEDLSQQTVQIALQGRQSQKLLSEFYEVSNLRYYHFKTFGDTIISRTGYTGEDGFEIYAPVEEGLKLFRELVQKAKPCGLGARDVLRIEAGFPLYGHEISEDITPLEANLDRFVDLSKNFVGKEAMLKRDLRRKLFGLELLERGVPREGYEILKDGKVVGVVSSGTFSPTLDKGIALCFVELDERREGNGVLLRVRNRSLRGVLRNYPFIKRPKG